MKRSIPLPEPIGASGRSRTRRRGGKPDARHRPLAEAVLQFIWQEQRISRAEIARRSGLSRSTVSGIVDLLLPTGLVAETGTGPSAGGRRPILLEFQDGAFDVLGVEMGATHVAVALTDLRARVLAWRHRDFPVRSDPVATRRLIRELCEECLAERPARTGHLVGIGIAVPSPVDFQHPELLPRSILPEWHGQSGLDEIRRHFGVPLWVDNDASLGALAEQWWGAGRGVEDSAYIKMATGIGSGFILRGEIYRGASGIAGEIGHVAIEPQGELCICGLRGCLATLIGSQALEARARSLLDEYPGSPLARGPVTVTAIEDAALAGDPLGRRIAHEAAGYLSVAIADLLHLMNPSLVILGGGLSRLGELLLEPLRSSVASRTFVESVQAAVIRMSDLGPRTVVIGAATLVLQAALRDSRLFPSPGKARSRR